MRAGRGHPSRSGPPSRALGSGWERASAGVAPGSRSLAGSFALSYRSGLLGLAPMVRAPPAGQRRSDRAGASPKEPSERARARGTFPPTAPGGIPFLRARGTRLFKRTRSRIRVSTDRGSQRATSGWDDKRSCTRHRAADRPGAPPAIGAGTRAPGVRPIRRWRSGGSIRSRVALRARGPSEPGCRRIRIDATASGSTLSARCRRAAGPPGHGRLPLAIGRGEAHPAAQGERADRERNPPGRADAARLWSEGSFLQAPTALNMPPWTTRRHQATGRRGRASAPRAVHFPRAFRPDPDGGRSPRPVPGRS